MVGWPLENLRCCNSAPADSKSLHEESKSNVSESPSKVVCSLREGFAHLCKRRNLDPSCAEVAMQHWTGEYAKKVDSHWRAWFAFAIDQNVDPYGMEDEPFTRWAVKYTDNVHSRMDSVKSLYRVRDFGQKPGYALKMIAEGRRRMKPGKPQFAKCFHLFDLWKYIRTLDVLNPDTSLTTKRDVSMLLVCTYNIGRVGYLQKLFPMAYYFKTFRWKGRNVRVLTGQFFRGKNYRPSGRQTDFENAWTVYPPSVLAVDKCLSLPLVFEDYLKCAKEKGHIFVEDKPPWVNCNKPGDFLKKSSCSTRIKLLLLAAGIEPKLAVAKKCSSSHRNPRIFGRCP